MRSILAVSLLLVSAVLLADDPTEKELKAFRDDVAATHKKVLGRLDYQIRKGGLEQSVRKQLGATAKAIKSGETIVLPWILPKSVRVGAIGRLPEGRVQQVIDEKTVLMSCAEDTLPVWLTGYDTKGVAESEKTSELQQCVRITGTKTYETVLGAKRTVYVAEPFDYTKAFPKARGVYFASWSDSSPAGY